MTGTEVAVEIGVLDRVVVGAFDEDRVKFIIDYFRGAVFPDDVVAG